MHKPFTLLIPSFTPLRFKFSWRKYQQNFLNHFAVHKKDSHLHVIAPPGSGKTLLGIEMLRQIGEKTLVLSPTLTIRNQWESRLQEFFSTSESFKDYSFEISNPADITFSTYQGLHAFNKKQISIEAFLEHFKKHDIECLVLDEAHHLKNEWWKCLYALKQKTALTIIALTATPPYDSGSAEIQRYFELCGPIDEEIAIPDLVKEGDLCPHQDFVHFSMPDDYTINYIYDFRQKVSQLLVDVTQDKAFKTAMLQHRFYKHDANHLSEIYQNPTYFSALIIFLQASGVAILQEKLKVLGFNSKEKVSFPALTTNWLEILFNHLYFFDKNQLSITTDSIKDWEKRLRKLGVLKTNRVDLIGNNKFYKVLSTNISKLNSIVNILETTSANLKDNLRGVVLTDFIRKEYLDCSEEDILKINKLGVLPIFHRLRVANIDKNAIGVITGSLVIVSKALMANVASSYPTESYQTIAFKADSNFVVLRKSGSKGMSLVALLTELFQKGYIKILIGTKSLLGEGWDAPAINTLVLASFVGSFVSSNQMRGRAIRSYKKQLDKTAVIWHLACLDPSEDSGGEDYETLERRFTAFMGISIATPVCIKDGIERLDLQPKAIIKDIKKQNELSLTAANNKVKVTKDWEEAVVNGGGITRELKQYYGDKRFFKKRKNLYYKNVVAYSFIQIIISLTLFFPEYILKNAATIFSENIGSFLYKLLIALVLGFGYQTIKAIRLYIRYGNPHKQFKKIAITVLNTLNDLEYITSNLKALKIAVTVDAEGTISCRLEGASNYESSVFISTLEEVVSPIENPRYLIIRKPWYKRIFRIENFFTVPSIFGEKKQTALLFLGHWNKELGRSKLVYTRHELGRKLLLKARIFHISNAKKKLTKKAVIWY